MTILVPFLVLDFIKQVLFFHCIVGVSWVGTTFTPGFVWRVQRTHKAEYCCCTHLPVGPLPCMKRDAAMYYTVFENYLKIFVFASKASYVNFQKTFGYSLLPLVYSFEFWQFLGYLHFKNNHQEFKRTFKGQKCITKGFQSNRLVPTKVRVFLGYEPRLSG